MFSAPRASSASFQHCEYRASLELPHHAPYKDRIASILGVRKYAFCPRTSICPWILQFDSDNQWLSSSFTAFPNRNWLVRNRIGITGRIGIGRMDLRDLRTTGYGKDGVLIED